MNIGTVLRLSRGSVIVGFVLVVLVIAGSLALVAPAAAVAHTAPPGGSVPAVPLAIPGVPDVGRPGEVIGRQSEPTIDPHGNPVWPSEDSHTPVTPTDEGSLVRSGWTYVVGVVDGARIRTKPVTGTVIGLIPYGAYYWISCKVRGSDGYIWGYANHDRRYGWVRDDLWDVVYFTAPTAPAPRPIPWC
jgi:hypothetical protein